MESGTADFKEDSVTASLASDNEMLSWHLGIALCYLCSMLQQIAYRARSCQASCSSAGVKYQKGETHDAELYLIAPLCYLKSKQRLHNPWCCSGFYPKKVAGEQVEVGMFMKGDLASGGFLTSHATQINWPQLHCGWEGRKVGEVSHMPTVQGTIWRNVVLRIHPLPTGSLHTKEGGTVQSHSCQTAFLGSAQRDLPFGDLFSAMYCILFVKCKWAQVLFTFSRMEYLIFFFFKQT